MTAKPFSEWFRGPWRVIPETSLGDRTRLAPGEIMRHHTGQVVINCPACNAMQIGSGVKGDPQAPTLAAPVHCGKGFCHRCGVWFTIVGGRTEEAKKPPVRTTAIPPELRRNGVRPAPSLEPLVRKNERELAKG